MSTTAATTVYIVNAPDCDDDDHEFDTFDKALEFFTDEGVEAGYAAEALEYAEEYAHNECRLNGRRYYVWVEERPAGPARQIRQTGIVTEELGSGITSVNHIDTYGCFPLGETEHEAVEYDILASILASECLDDGGIGFEELPEEIQKPWIAGSPWCAHSGDELWTVTYDHDGWLRELAEASVDLLSSQYDLGEVVHSVEFTGEVWSPQFYNFSTDGYMARWTIDTDALEQWLADNGAVLGDGRGIPGFYRTADDEVWYLGQALREYLEYKIPDYVSDMYSYLAGNGVEDQYIEVELTEAGRAWIEEYKRAK